MPKHFATRYLSAICWILSILPFIVTYASYPFLRDRIAIHFALPGVADGWADKSMIVVFPLIFFALACGFALSSRYAVKRAATSGRDMAVTRSYALVAMIGVLLVFNVNVASVIVVNASAFPGSGMLKLVFALIGILLLLYGVSFSDWTKRD